MTRRVLAALALWLLASGCTKDSYVIGATCGALGACQAGSAGDGAGGASAGMGGSAAVGGDGEAGADPPGTLQVDFTGSGVERLPDRLFGEVPSHLLIADDAELDAWPARIGEGFEALAGASVEPGLPAPFADNGRVLSHAGAAAFGSDGSWAETGGGALALEVVFRAEPGAVLLSQRDAGGGLELLLDESDRLSWRLDAGASELVVSSQALVPDAWHHCLALFDAGQGAAQLFCNGQPGVEVSIPSGFSVPVVSGAATLGGGGGARVSWAELARWQAASWGPRGAWSEQARERFARLVGTYADGSREPLPFSEMRASGAYIDMTASDAPELRRLFPVGEHWPRVVCRPTNDSARLCGLLVEAASSRTLAEEDFSLDNWSAAELALAAGSASGPTGAQSLFGLIPSMLATEHSLELDAPFGEGPAVFWLFARAGSGGLLRAEVAGVASATFDLNDASVVATTDTLLASAEPWGDGLLRLSMAFDIAAGPGQLRLQLLDQAGSEVFAGDGSVAAELGDVELRFRSYSTPLPTFGAIQRADQLVYPTGNGNLPEGPWFRFSAEIWLPEAPLVADAAVLNANFADRFDQQINLFVRPADGGLNFWGKQGDATQWQVSAAAALTDGALHRIIASVGPDGASLSVDGQLTRDRAGSFDISVLDRIDVGCSANSSGALTGLVRSIAVSSPE